MFLKKKVMNQYNIFTCICPFLKANKGQFKSHQFFSASSGFKNPIRFHFKMLSCKIWETM